MKMKYLIIASIFMGATISHAQDASNIDQVDGAWFGGYQKGQDDIKLKLVNVAGFGRLEINASGWEPIGYGICQYVFQYQSLAVSEIYLNGSFGTPEKCPANLAFEMERTGPDGIKLVFKNETPLAEAEFVAGLRPLRDEDRRVKVRGLDVLGVKTGMTQAEAEGILKQAGYEYDEKSTKTVTGDAGWTLETRYYLSTEEGIEKNSDVVTVAYSESKTAKVMIVGRNWDIPESAKLSELTIKNSLQDKYGTRFSSTGEERAYDRDGNNIIEYWDRNEKCKEGTRQTIPFSFYSHNGIWHNQINTYCGPRTEIVVGATYLNMWIADPDEIWDNFWRTWSISAQQELETLYQSVTGATGEAPKL